MNVYCSECGSKNEDNAAFCTSCGANIDQRQPSQSFPLDPKPPKSYRNVAIAIALAVLLLMTGLFGFVHIFLPSGDPFVADDHVLYGDGAVGSGIISVVSDPSDVDPYDDISTVTLTFEKYDSWSYDWSIRSLDKSFFQADYNSTSSDYYYYSEREYKVPEGATFSEDGRSMTCSLSPGHYSVNVIVLFQKYVGSFVVGGEVTRNYEWIYDIPGGPDDSFELDFKFQYGECVSGITYGGPRGYIDFNRLDTVFKTYVYDGIVVTEDLESKLKTLYINSSFSIYGDDDYYYASFILSFVQQVVSYYPEDLSEEAMPGDLMSADKRIYGANEYWAFPTETIMQGAGDCEDTSFLCAALFRAAGLDTALVMLPGHVMAGVYLEYGIDPPYPHYPGITEYVISEDIFDSTTSTIKTYYGCETTADEQYLLGYTNLTDELDGVEYELKEWLPSGIHATYSKTYGFYVV